jgi:hypothetical protein
MKKNSVKKKNSGNSVHLRIYCHVLSISMPSLASYSPFQKPIENDALLVVSALQNQMFTFEIDSENVIVVCTLEH